MYQRKIGYFSSFTCNSHEIFVHLHSYFILNNKYSMYRSNTCGELRLADVNKEVTLSGWVSKIRKMGGMTFIDLRDRYGITQLSFNQEVNHELCEQANKLGREWVIQVTGTVKERSSKNAHIPTGEIEIIASELTVLNASKTPPFTIETDTDGGDDLRMKCATRWRSKHAVTWTRGISWKWKRRY